jgi:2,4-dienoyl-CoA reductase-like NADH-dependent reductase (Old Yellow Enzyme family)
VTSDTQVWTDGEIEQLISDYVQAAKIARDVGADFVDIKHCHGYLLHEFLSARTRDGRYGGSFENRTRILREIVSGIRSSGTRIDIGVRLSAFDFVPFRPDPAQSLPGKPGPGIPEDYSNCLPYLHGFGVNADNPVEPDLTETFKFAELCSELGIRILNITAGSPYYNPHIQRPAAYPPSDGYLPPEDPLVGVARQISAVRRIKAHLEASSARDAGTGSSHPVIIGSAYSYLQEYLPHVAQHVIRDGWTDMVGLGRMVLAYPNLPGDSLTKGQLEKKLICRTFSDCTTAPRNGLISGCYPLDRYYAAKPEFKKLKEIKRAQGTG